MAAQRNIVIYQGSDFSMRVHITTGGQPFNLTGYDGRSQVRFKMTDAQPYISFDVSVTDAANGTIDWRLPASVTRELDFKKHPFALYDLEMESPDGIVTRIFFGRVTLHKEVTR